ncbi:Elongation factor 1-delta [Desmophyllum pertusum]|uniref:Elongation factor 1-delta n=1 Tax=Desmophyllum pertusum TaxID=174260 RepID=A0A9W9YLZ4_9CNID|nr:Elongation factor 1-delta [Desmophyllum pertusum]
MPYARPVSCPEVPGSQASSFSPVQEIAKARKKIQQTLSTAPTSPPTAAGGDKRIAKLEEEKPTTQTRYNITIIILFTEELRDALQQLTVRVSQLEKGDKVQPSAHPSAPQKKEQKAEKDDDDDDFDLFGSDDEEEEEDEDAAKKARLEAYAAKKAKKPALIAKSNIILDIKPVCFLSWYADLKAMEKAVRSIECDGLVWQASKLLPVAYGIKKLQIACMIEDDKVGTDFLEEEITAFEDFVQSVDIAAFNKL